MDLHYSQTQPRHRNKRRCFTTLWIYTILKLVIYSSFPANGFTTLWIYTILKHSII